jgi:hypothetical protein
MAVSLQDGPRFEARKALRDQVESESANREKSLQEELAALNMRLEIGEITEQEFEQQEA